MDAEALRARQAPLKERYLSDPSSARVVMTATGVVEPASQICRVTTPQGEIVAGLHPAAGGSGQEACSGDMLLQSLVACTGVTLGAVATAMRLDIHQVKVQATAELDFRGTMGLDKSLPVGMQAVTLNFEFETQCPTASLEKLVELTERYCVIWRTLMQPAKLSTHWSVK